MKESALYRLRENFESSFNDPNTGVPNLRFLQEAILELELMVEKLGSKKLDKTSLPWPDSPGR